MEEERRNSVAEDVVVEEEADGNGETDGGLTSRSRKKRLLEKEVEIEGAAVVDCQVAVEHKRSVYLDQEEGTKSSDEINSTELQKADRLVAAKIMQNNESDCLSEHGKDVPVIENHNHHRNDLKVENQPISEEEFGRKLTGKEFVSKSEQVKLLSENKSVVEIDLERILEEQDTHDLYCPNCHSCITKRVILRKRKRTARENISNAKREKIEPVQADLTANTPATENTGQSDDTEPDVFRCLSCLSFFIPTDSGFRLFKVFGKREENENVQSSQMPGRHQNWMFSFFELMKRKNKGSGLEDPLLADSHDGYGGKADNIQREKQQITSDACLSEAILPGKHQNDIKEEQINVTKYSDAA